MNGGILGNKGAIPMKELPLSERRGMKGLSTLCPQQAGAGREVLSSFFLRTIYMFLIGFTFCQKFTFPAAYFNVNFRTALSLITDQIAHILKSPFRFK
jgi:hypothetical protein